MNTDKFELVKQLFNEFTSEQKDEFIRLLSNEKQKDVSSDKFNEISLNNCLCPHCKSNKIIKKGLLNGKQKFHCSNCKKWFSIQTKTMFANSKKSLDVWYEYIDLMFQGLSLQKIADKMGINYKTSFYWRHKILATVQKMETKKLSGIVEADETYFYESQKGKKQTGRKSRTRGYRSKKMSWETNRLRGLSVEQVCVLTAIDRSKNSFVQPVGYGKMNKSYTKQLQGQIKKGATLITDGDTSYRSVKGVKLKQIAGGITKDKVYNIQRINSYHSGLKKFMGRFNGVATKYLDNYVNFYKMDKLGVNVFDGLLNVSHYTRQSDLNNKVGCFRN